eukprot:3605583-Pyramimonas_sp.AAC.1
MRFAPQRSSGSTNVSLPTSTLCGIMQYSLAAATSALAASRRSALCLAGCHPCCHRSKRAKWA